MYMHRKERSRKKR